MNYQWSIVSLILVSIFLTIWLWVFRDAGARGKPGCLVALLVFGLFPIGLIIWLIFRPDYVEDNKGQSGQVHISQY